MNDSQPHGRATYFPVLTSEANARALGEDSVEKSPLGLWFLATLGGINLLDYVTICLPPSPRIGAMITPSTLGRRFGGEFCSAFTRDCDPS